jgi:hypothetical protein
MISLNIINNVNECDKNKKNTNKDSSFDLESKDLYVKNMNFIYNKNLERTFDYFKSNLQSNIKILPKFLYHNKVFPRTGKQGIIGSLSLNSKNKEDIIYKISQNFDFVIEQENIVLQGLNSIRHYCPHFCKGFGKTITGLLNDFKHSVNPFDIDKESSKNITDDVLFMENIKNSRKFCKYIKKETFDENMVFSIIKQVLIAVAIAQQEKKLTHYDLHSNNVMISKFELNSCFVYKLSEKDIFLVPTYGYCPIIIDFGFSYIEDMEKKPLYGSLLFTKIGFTSDRYDEISDHKLFLNSVSSELKMYRDKTPNIRTFSKFVDKTYENLSIDKSCGWDKNEDDNAGDYIYDQLKKQLHVSKFFKKYGFFCIDMIRAVITLPLRKRNIDIKDTIKDMREYFSHLLKEFAKIEKEISNDFYNLYIFKKLIVFSIKYKKEWLENKNNDHIIKFKRDVYETIDTVVNFCNPKGIDFEKLLCSIIAVSDCMEDLLSNFMEKIMKNKKAEYKKMKTNNIKDIIYDIDCKIKSPFVFDKNTKFYIFDCTEKRSYSFILNNQEEIDDMNECDSVNKGQLLLEIFKYNEKNKSSE